MEPSELVGGDGTPDPGFIGRGIRFPMRVDHTGSIALTTGPDEIDRAARVIIATAPGERVMRPEFGCRIWDLVFEPVNANTLGAMESAVREALERWEPRIEVGEIDVVPDDEPACVRISISYVIRSTNDRRNLVYPFYVIPHDSE